MEEAPKRRYRLILDFKCQFPEKLYEVANDGALIKWNRNGSVSVPDWEKFEENVMKWYPGFLQIASFQNLKRLFREYGFDRDINQNNECEWSHEMFIPGRRDLLQEIKTRRKSFRTPQNRQFNENTIITPTDGRRFPLRKRARTKYYCQDTNSNDATPSKPDYGGGGEGFTPNNFVNTGNNNKQSFILKSPFHPGTSQVLENGNIASDNKTVNSETDNRNQNAVKRDFTHIIDSYAEKEFTEQEYMEWVAKQRKLDEAKTVKEDQKQEPAKSTEFWWMYKDSPGEIVQTVNIPLREPGNLEEFSTPCGFCKCCSAISNYVHLFGEIPENIQVIDCLEEIVETVEPQIKLG